MSNQPIALGGPAPIALGGGPIALGPTDHNDNKPANAQQNVVSEVNGDQEEPKKPKQDYTWADEVRINDETVITIPVEHILYGEPEKRKRKSRWGERPDLKKKVHQDVVFNPYQALTGGSHLLPITDGRDPSQILFGTTRDEDKQPEDQKRSTKWGPEWEKTFQPPMYNHIPKGMSIDDVEYLMRLQRLDDITRSLNGDLEIGDADIRSPSPDPVYDKNGVRVNTRVVRAKDKLLREKSDLIEECQKLRKNFVAPAEYKPPKKGKKIFLPESEGGFDNQYIGKVIGPKGATQKRLESKTGCKISIRGKGSSKQKKTEYDSDEKLHVLIQADTDEAVESGAQEVEKILRGDIDETNEELKAKQLQVAAISGALGDDYCTNCSEPGHKSYACPNRASITRVTIKCAICGDRSHPTSDCPNKKAQGAGFGIQHELASFMASLTGAKKPEQQPMGMMGGTNFMTNAPKPVLALTFGGAPMGPMTYPQQPMFPGFGGAPMMNPYAATPQPQMPQMPQMPQVQQAQPQPQQVRQQPPSNPAFAHSTTESTITRPPAYSMPATAGGPYFINPMSMNYIPQNMQGGGQASNVTITNVNPTAPMGMPTTGTTQPGVPSGYIMPPGSTSNTAANPPQTGTYQYSSAPFIRK